MKAVREASSHVVINGRLVYHWATTIPPPTGRQSSLLMRVIGKVSQRPTSLTAGTSLTIPTSRPRISFDSWPRPRRGRQYAHEYWPHGHWENGPQRREHLGGHWWMVKVNGESIRGTERTPLTPQTWGNLHAKAIRFTCTCLTGRLMASWLSADSSPMSSRHGCYPMSSTPR